MICPMCNKQPAIFNVAGMTFCKQCANILNNDKKAYEQWKTAPHWIDYTDYFPSAHGFGDDPTEPYWRFECSECGDRVFDEENPPQTCPHCGAHMKGVR